MMLSKSSRVVFGFRKRLSILSITAATPGSALTNSARRRPGRATRTLVPAKAACGRSVTLEVTSTTGSPPYTALLRLSAPAATCSSLGSMRPTNCGTRLSEPRTSAWGKWLRMSLSMRSTRTASSPNRPSGSMRLRRVSTSTPSDQFACRSPASLSSRNIERRYSGMRMFASRKTTGRTPGITSGVAAVAALAAVLAFGLLAGADFFVPVTAPWPPSDASLSSWLRRVRAAADRR